MGFRLVPKSVTLNDLERRNGRVVCVISPNSAKVLYLFYRQFTAVSNSERIVKIG